MITVYYLFVLLLSLIGATYIALNAVLDRENDRSEGRYSLSVIRRIKRRNYKCSFILFSVAILTMCAISLHRDGWHPAEFQYFSVVFLMAACFGGVFDLTNNCTYLYKRMPQGMNAILIYATFASWLMALFTLFFWLTWLAVTVTLAICAAGMYFWYIDFKSDKNNE